jgi:hypothetical protein
MTRPLKLDWEELEESFTNQNEELVYYVDLVNGHVVLEGGAEDEGFDDEDQDYMAGGGGAQSRRDDRTRAYIDPPDHVKKLEWMKTFLDEVDDLDAEVVGLLREAAAADDPVSAVNEVLRQHPEGRDRWYLYRSDRLHDMIDEWLVTHKITAVDPPPWK